MCGEQSGGQGRVSGNCPIRGPRRRRARKHRPIKMPGSQQCPIGDPADRRGRCSRPFAALVRTCRAQAQVPRTRRSHVPGPQGGPLETREMVSAQDRVWFEPARIRWKRPWAGSPRAPQGFDPSFSPSARGGALASCLARALAPGSQDRGLGRLRCAPGRGAISVPDRLLTAVSLRVGRGVWGDLAGGPHWDGSPGTCSVSNLPLPQLLFLGGTQLSPDRILVLRRKDGNDSGS